MHANGINHRDFYICHFLLDVSADVYRQSPQALRLSLIDLHRVQLRKRTPSRWVVKDIGGLYFSSMRIGLTRRDLYRFMKVYRDYHAASDPARGRQILEPLSPACLQPVSFLLP